MIADKGPLDEECLKEAGDCPRYQVQGLLGGCCLTLSLGYLDQVNMW